MNIANFRISFLSLYRIYWRCKFKTLTCQKYYFNVVFEVFDLKRICTAPWYVPVVVVVGLVHVVNVGDHQGEGGGQHLALRIRAG